MTGSDTYTLAAGLYSLQATEMSGSWPIFSAASLIVSLPILIVFSHCKEHDRRSDLRWSEGIDRRKRKYESKCSITYTHVPVCIRTDEEHIVIRLRAGRGDLTECILHYGDRACRLTPVLLQNRRWQWWRRRKNSITGRLRWSIPIKDFAIISHCPMAGKRCCTTENDSRIIPWMTARNIISCRSITAQILLHLPNGHRIRSSIIFSRQLCH